MMSRLLVHVEGKTEQDFVRNVLAEHLSQHGFCSVDARLMGNARPNARRGGVCSWPSAKRDIVNHLRRDPDLIVTTMVDYYGLPQDENRSWPKRADASASRGSSGQKARLVEEAMLNDVQKEMGSNFNQQRFLPYLMMHEFEALLFSDCQKFAQVVSQSDIVDKFQRIRNDFDSPEEINDSPETAPSKRIKHLIPRYQKVLWGTQAVRRIGLPKIRAECPHFACWLDQLERLPTVADAEQTPGG